MTIYYLGIALKESSYDLCTGVGVTCPLDAGVAFKAVVTQSVTSSISFTGTLELVATDGSGNKLSCIDIDITVQAKVKESEESLFREEFKKYKVKFNKKYSSYEEEEFRYMNFKNSIMRVTFKNTYGDNIFGLTKFSDMSPEEFSSVFLNYKPRGPMEHVSEIQTTTDIPSSFDWRDEGAVTPVKNQGYCGSCWAFSVVETIESAWEIAGNTLTEFSEQQIVSCDTNDGGCDGGNPPVAYKYVEQAGGLALETDFPYSSSSGSAPPCQNFTVAGGQISGYSYATRPCFGFCKRQNEDKLAASVATIQPPSICVDASSWSDYTGGVMTTSSCSSSYLKLDHCVQLVGYSGYNGDASTSTSGYWIVRNSWGTDWGEEGYIYLQMGTNTCGVADEATVVTIA